MINDLFYEVEKKTAFHLPDEIVINKCHEPGVYSGYIASCLWNKELYNMNHVLYRFLRLRRYSDSSLEAACRRAVYYSCCTLDMVYLILNHELYRLDLDPDTDVFGQLFINFPEE